MQIVIAIYIFNLWLQAFLSRQRKKDNMIQSSNYLPERTQILIQRSNSLPQRAKNTVNDLPQGAKNNVNTTTLTLFFSCSTCNFT